MAHSKTFELLCRIYIRIGRIKCSLKKKYSSGIARCREHIICKTLVLSLLDEFLKLIERLKNVENTSREGCLSSMLLLNKGGMREPYISS